MLDREDVASLREEIADGDAARSEMLAAVRRPGGAETVGSDAPHETYGAHLRNVAMGAELVGSTALAEAAAILERNLGHLQQLPGERRDAVCELLTQWSSLFLSYLEAPSAESAGAVINYLSDPTWPTPLNVDEGDGLRTLFAQDGTPLGSTAVPGATPLSADDEAEVSPELDAPPAAVVAPWPEGRESASIEDELGMADPVALETGVVQAGLAQEDMSEISDVLTREDGDFVPEGFVHAASEDDAVPSAVAESEARGAEAAADAEHSSGGAALPAPALDAVGQSVAEEQMGAEDEAAPLRGDAEATAAADGRDRATEDMLGALAAEISGMRSELEGALADFAAAADGSPALVEAVERYSGVLDRLAATCEMLGLAGLGEVCAFVGTNLLECAGESREARAALHEPLSGWPARVLDYLRQPADDAACKALVRHLQAGAWPSPLGDDASRELLRRLVEGPSAMQAEAQAYTRPAQLQPEDVSLRVPDDVKQELLAAFLQEAPQQAAEFSECVQKIHDRKAGRDDVKLAQRVAHTLKGSAHLIGIRGIATLTHQVEDILEFLAAHEVSAPPTLVATLTEAADCLEEMIDALAERGEAPAGAFAVLQRVLDWANRIDRDELADDAEADAPAWEPAGDARESRPERRAAAEQRTPAEQQVLRVPTRAVDELLRLVGELSMSITQLQDRYERAVEHLRTLREQGELVQGRSFELEDLVDIRGVGVMQGRLRRTGTHDQAFDPLELNQYNELHSITQGVIEAASDAREFGGVVQDDLARLEELLVRQERLNKVLQQAVMATRMVPVRNIIPRLERTVRQTCRATRKQAQLEVSGQDILMDGEVLQKLGNPLMHILRNAIDHGIEFAGERARVGKPERGRIGLHFSRVGNAILLRCEDDGRGLDRDKIREVGLERGLIEPGAEIGDRELTRLLFTPGFSTQSSATHTSGRGIGLDVVYATVIGMKGSVEIESAPGAGCCISLRLPVSLITAHVLLVQVGAERYGVPTTNLEQILAGGSGKIEPLDDGPVLHFGEERYPVHRLSVLLHQAQASDADVDLGAKPVLLVRADAGVSAIAVDRVIGGRDLVIKGMGRYIRGVTGVLGATVLGDGTALPVLDIAEMLRTPIEGSGAQPFAVEAEAPRRGAVRVLIVDDSLSARRSLSELVRDAGYEPLLAKDGLEAVDVLEDSNPDIVLLDLEMPRMNGLEFTAHVRGRIETEHLPIVMVTSRSTDKHRRQAMLAGVSAYLTKPFQESELLDVLEAALRRELLRPVPRPSA